MSFIFLQINSATYININITRGLFECCGFLKNTLMNEIALYSQILQIR